MRFKEKYIRKVIQEEIEHLNEEEFEQRDVEIESKDAEEHAKKIVQIKKSLGAAMPEANEEGFKAVKELDMLYDWFGNKSSDEKPVPHNEMARVWANLDHVLNTLSQTVPADEEEAQLALRELETLHNWFDAKLTGGEDPEGMEWLRKPSEEEKKYFGHDKLQESKIDESREGVLLALSNLRELLRNELDTPIFNKANSYIVEMGEEFKDALSAREKSGLGYKQGAEISLKPSDVSGPRVTMQDDPESYRGLVTKFIRENIKK